MIVLSMKLGEEGIALATEKFKALIEQNGIVESVETWGTRKLAYPINYETEGYYLLINFTCDPNFLAELDRVYGITENVIRTIIVKKDA
jgi:small subunit ribosomal protein S6